MTNRTRKTIVTISLAMAMALTTSATLEAKTTHCKIKVVGGSFKGRSFPVTMEDGKFVGQSGMSESNLPGCRVKKKVYGRWYHLCKRGTLIVYKWKNSKWTRLQPKSLLKYQHTCF